MYPVYRWNGSYFGFVINGYLFDRKAHYLGWVTDGIAWKADGTYLGDVHPGGYVLRNTAKRLPAPQTPRSFPPQPSVPSPWSDRPPKSPLAGFLDGLAAFPDT